MTESVRPSWDKYFMDIVDVVSSRSTCDRGKPGCVFTKNNHILTTGYAGSPPGLQHCSDVGHKFELHAPVECDGFLDPRVDDFRLPIRSIHCVRTIHAEQNAILQAAKNGISLEGSTVYVSMTPCRTCAMMLISVGVERVVCGKIYQKAQESINMFKQADIPIVHLEETVQKY